MRYVITLSLLLIPACSRPRAELEFSTSQENVRYEDSYSPSFRYKIWDNYLVIGKSRQKIPLSATSEVSNFTYDKYGGCDIKTLSVRHLSGPKLCWVSWRTHAKGAGRYIHEGHLLLLRSRGRYIELFRDMFQSFAKGGWSSSHRESLSFSYSDNRVHLRSSTEVFVGGYKREHPLWVYLWTADSGHDIYGFGYTKENTWHYKIEDKALRYVSGTSEVQLEHAHPKAELEKYFKCRIESSEPSVSGRIAVASSLPEYKFRNFDNVYGGSPK